MSWEVGTIVQQEFMDLYNSVPEKVRDIDGIANIDPFALAQGYFSEETVADLSIDTNANISGKSNVNFHSEIFKPLLKVRSYWKMWRELQESVECNLEEANEAVGACIDGRLYFHDITKIDVPYCFAYDTSFMMFEGRPYGWLPGSKPKRLESYNGQIVETTMDMSQEFAGAIGVPNYLVNMAYFTKHYDDKTIENCQQQFVHVMHNTFRIGGDSPFTNTSLFDEPTVLKMFDTSVYPDGSRVIDNIDEIMRVQEIFANFFSKGSPVTGKNYRFPVVTANIKVDESTGDIKDMGFFNFVVDKNRERGVFNIHQGDKVASCCRLTSDLAALKETIRQDTFGNGGLSIGSHRVVAINLHRAALMANEAKIDFLEVLDKDLTMVEKLLIAHKNLLARRVKQRALKFFNVGWANLKMFFSTIGFTGLWDAYEVLKEGVSATELPYTYVEFAQKVLKHLEDFAKAAGKRNDGFAFNVEEIPAENASPKLAAKDAFYYGTDRQLLSNQMIPLYVDTPLYDRLETAGKLMNIVSGGSILHLNMQDAMTVGANRAFHKELIEKYKIPHYAVNIGTTTCVNGHTTTGVHQVCPVCNGEIDTYTIRVVGFNTDTRDWGKVRRSYEMPRRQFYHASDVK